MRQQIRHLRLPLPLHGRRDQIAVGGVADRRLEQIRKRQLAEFFRNGAPGRTAGNGHRIPAAHRYRRAPLEMLGRHLLRRAPRGVAAASFPSAQISAKASPPIPFWQGSTTVSAIAVASTPHRRHCRRVSTSQAPPPRPAAARSKRRSRPAAACAVTYRESHQNDGLDGVIQAFPLQLRIYTDFGGRYRSLRPVFVISTQPTRPMETPAP